MMKKIFLALSAACALFQMNAEEPLLEVIFADPTTFYNPKAAENVITFKNKKVFFSKRYPMSAIPVEEYDGKSAVLVTVRAARDNSQPAMLGVVCQVYNRSTKKMLSGGMAVKRVSEDFTDLQFKVYPGKLLPGTKEFRLLFYTVGKKGKIYLESIKVIPFSSGK